MKGDEVIKMGEEGADGLLLFECGESQWHVKKRVLMNTFRFSTAISNHAILQIEAFLSNPVK